MNFQFHFVSSAFERVKKWSPVKTMWFEYFSDKKNGTLALICELMDMNLYEMIRGKSFYESICQLNF